MHGRDAPESFEGPAEGRTGTIDTQYAGEVLFKALGTMGLRRYDGTPKQSVYDRWQPARQLAARAVHGGSPAMSEANLVQLIEQLQALGVRRGGVVLVHTAFRAVGPVEGGPLGLIAALRSAVGPEGTLVMPTMTSGEAPFDPRSTPTAEMGITAELFWRQPGVLRSTHPSGSFGAQGPKAEWICQPQPLSPPHGPDSPVGRVHQLGGQVLLLGVTHSEDTTLHLAEALARVPYSTSSPCLVEAEGVTQTVLISEPDHCCVRFRLVDGWLRARGLQREGKVGRADARLCDSREIVAVAVEHLLAEPLTFLCEPGQGCPECDRARASVPEAVPPPRPPKP
jgi:aminoglycoside 3-N-acetyltransferase